ncbi:MAG: methylcobamide--CoM methyltransferase MtbA [Deltaproteobacteria bacterium]|nr:methylcobamide--CoM methyltransferase MtbA [Deltaproteobacteria bacterium]
MNHDKVSSMDRVLTTLSHKEPDRVPLFLLPTLHGAKELGLSIKDYFKKAENVAKGQLQMREKYGHDCLSGFFYGPIEVEAFGAEVIYCDDGPPNSGTPLIRDPEKILTLTPPHIEHSKCLLKVLHAISIMKETIKDEAPIIGVAMSPFSLPVMQLGFDRYIEVMYERPDLFSRLMEMNQGFCISWSNAQLKAGATAICYFDPVSSSGMIPPEMYLKTGFQMAQKTLSQIQGPTATHFASERCLPIIKDVARTGTAIVGVSAFEDLAKIKTACKENKLTVLGNLNGIEMRRWTPDETERIVKKAIAQAGPGGGFILSDNHGEIPWQVPDEVLMAISEAVHLWGRYPLDWV